MATHELKIAPRWYEDVSRWQKNFEIRSCKDRDFKVGDTLILKEWDKGKFTDRPNLIRKVEYVYKGDGTYGLSEDWCILGLKKEGFTFQQNGNHNIQISNASNMTINL